MYLMESLKIETKGLIDLAIKLNQEGLDDIRAGNFDAGISKLMKQVSILNLTDLDISKTAKQQLKQIIMVERL